MFRTIGFLMVVLLLASSTSLAGSVRNPFWLNNPSVDPDENYWSNLNDYRRGLLDDPAKALSPSENPFSGLNRWKLNMPSIDEDDPLYRQFKEWRGIEDEKEPYWRY
jgi:hypothetical protein